MKAIRTSIAGVDVLIEAVDGPVNVLGFDQAERFTQPTGVADNIEGAYEIAKGLLAAIAEDMGNRLSELRTSAKPKKVSLEFSLGFSAESGIWVLRGKADAGLKVIMAWE